MPGRIILIIDNIEEEEDKKDSGNNL